MNLRLTRSEAGLGVRWVAATAVGRAVGFFACEAVKSFVSTLYVDGLIIGASIGIAQWLVLRRQRVPSRWWVVLSILGFGIGKAAGDVVGQGLPTAVGAALTGAVIGLSVGIAQSIALGSKVSAAGWWVAANVAAWTLGWAIIRSAESSTLPVPAVYVGGAFGAATAGIITGSALIWIRRQGEGFGGPWPSP